MQQGYGAESRSFLLKPGGQSSAYRALTVADRDVNPDELAAITIWPAAPVDRTMASALPLNAFRVVPLRVEVSFPMLHMMTLGWFRTRPTNA